MHMTTHGGEAGAGAPTPEPRRGKDTRCFRHTDSGRPAPTAGFVGEHAHDRDSPYRGACEEEVLAVTGQEALRGARDECARKGRGSTRRLVYAGAVFEDAPVWYAGNRQTARRQMGFGENEGARSQAGRRRRRRHPERGRA